MRAVETPVSERDTFLGQAAEPRGSTAHLELPPDSGKCILIAEDNAIQRESTELVLCQWGYRIALANNGQEALNCLRSGSRIDLLILDMMLPIRDGWSLLAEKNRDPNLGAIPVIIMTALSIASKEWALSMGAIGFLRKPVAAEDLIKEIQRLI